MERKLQPRRLVAALAFAALAFANVRPLEAHTVGISRGDYRILGASVTADLVFARPEVAGAIPGLDTDGDGTLSAPEISAGRNAIESLFVRGLDVRMPSGSCSGALQDILLVEEDGISVRAVYACPSDPPTVTFELKFLAALSHGHRHLAAATAGSASVRTMAYRENDSFQLSPAAGGTNGGVVLPLFRLGIHHILTGYDHLVFLLGLIVIGGRTRHLLAAITAFTVAHSITLGLATLQVWAPSTRLAESAIALSIAYIGVENWYVKNASRRWLITFPFGLVHGFGFAGALRQIALPHDEIPKALFSFNAGVEAGQLAVIAVALPTILWLRRRPWFADRGVKVVSGAIALAGVWWFLLRVA